VYSIFVPKGFTFNYRLSHCVLLRQLLYHIVSLLVLLLHMLYVLTSNLGQGISSSSQEKVPVIV